MAPDWRSILILGLWGLQSACFVFDSEEIKSLNFVVDILDQPVLLNEKPEERTVQMYNRAGQAYSCLLPDTGPLLQQYREETETAQPASVPSLLAPMSSGPCLQRTRDWWTYELCPMSEIRQYHMEGGQIVGKTSVLGKFESDYDWTQDDGRSRNAKQRFHSQTYVNGSECDLTGRPRSAEVRYMCEEGSSDTLTRVDEPETCHYVLTVRTARVCAHRALAPPPGVRPQPVTCRPALSGEQMDRLETARRDRERRQEERRRREEEREDEEEQGEEKEQEGEEEEKIRKRKEKLIEELGFNDDTGDKELAYLRKMKQLFNGIASQTDSLGNVLDVVIHSYIDIVSELNTEAEYDIDRLHHLGKRHLTAQNHHAAHADRIRALFEQAEAGQYRTRQVVRDLIAYTGTLSIFSEVMIGITEESSRLKEFMSSDPAMVTDAMLGQLVKTMANLSALSKQLQRFFTQTEAWQADLLAWQAEADRLGLSEDTPPGHSGHGAGEDSDAADTDSLEAPESLTSGPEPSEEDHPSSEEDAVSSEDAEEGIDSEDDGEEDTRGEDGSSGFAKKRRVKFSTLRSLGLDRMLQASEIDKQQRERIERAVKRKLDKVGLDSKHGPEIKVRFLKLPDMEHLDKEHTLSEEEVAAFENALVAVMMGGSDALVEHEKHSEQAKNYEYDFDKTLRSLESEQDEQPTEESPAADESFFTLV